MGNNYYDNDYEPYPEGSHQPQESHLGGRLSVSIKRRGTQAVTYDDVLDFHLVLKKIKGINRGDINFFDQFRKQG